ncbi:MAG: redoxin domain-containing protein [Thermomicrobium sp.]|uniref:redoxin domain-containing protein n=1 Tax=Thermomicrobium sp. TaxID=1969469 RepID=UPI001B2EF3ED|nr:redoxin domain-containing protein [Thermomicrobium sp.]MBO9350372.1 redoxin domain-containing protein [Thermomicrobium sp.]
MTDPMIAVGDRIVDFTLEDLGGRRIETRRFYLRRGLVLVFLHEWPCADCLAYLRRISSLADEIARARSQLLAIVPLGRTLAVHWPGEEPPPFPLLLTEGEELHRRFGLLDGAGRPVTAVIVTDDTGTVWEIWRTGDQHDLPDQLDLLETVEYVSYQCPECWDRQRWP